MARQASPRKLKEGSYFQDGTRLLRVVRADGEPEDVLIEDSLTGRIVTLTPEEIEAMTPVRPARRVKRA